MGHARTVSLLPGPTPATADPDGTCLVIWVGEDALLTRVEICPFVGVSVSMILPDVIVSTHHPLS